MSTYLTISFNDDQGQDGYVLTKVYGEDNHWNFFDSGDFVEDFNGAMRYAKAQCKDRIVNLGRVEDFFLAEPRRYIVEYENGRATGIMEKG